MEETGCFYQWLAGGAVLVRVEQSSWTRGFMLVHVKILGMGFSVWGWGWEQPGERNYH